MSKLLIFVSENAAKYKEFKNMLDKMDNFDINFIMIKPEGELNEIQSLDRNEIIIHKLKTAKEMIKNSIHPNTEFWLMVEDTSFNIDTENSFPGPFIKYYLQINTPEHIANKNYNSKCKSIVTLGLCKIIPNDDTLNIHVFEDLIEGNITLPTGNNGFGFDSIFKPKNSFKTNAEMNINEKELFNPRINAFKKIINFIN